MSSKNAFSFQDVENALEKFDGESSKSSKKWVARFEEVAAAFEWNDVQKFLYCRRLLKDAAKIAVEAEENCVTWATLKEFLLKEFSIIVSSKAIHQKLSTTKKANDESLLQYFYKMKQISSACDIGESAVVEYIVAGINDSPSNKAILYTAKTCAELKAVFGAYEKLKDEEISTRKPNHKPFNGTHFNQANTQNSSNNNNNNNTNRKVNFKNNHTRAQFQYRCFNCGSREHKRADCTSETKCFKCNKFGHEAPNCPNATPTSSSNNVLNIILSSTNTKRIININGTSVEALIDTGSDVTIIQESAVTRITNIERHQDKSKLGGFGNGESSTTGVFDAIIKVDNVEMRGSCYIVKNNAIKVDLILGNDFICQAEIVVKRCKFPK